MTDSQRDASAEELLLPVSEQAYGEEYRNHYLTLYRDYVSSADSISNRRDTANKFFLTLNTAFLGAKGYIKTDAAVSPDFAVVQAVVGLLFCLVWWNLIKSYRTLNASKFDVIQQMERHLPLASFTTEEFVQNSGAHLHRALTSVEKFLPGVFGILHIAAAFWGF